eukprot:g3170.t1
MEMREREIHAMIEKMQVDHSQLELLAKMIDDNERAILQEWLCKSHEVQMKSKIASGSFGDVYKVLFRNTECAAKVLSKFTEQGCRDFVEEALLMTDFYHPCLLQLRCCCLEPPLVMIVLELAPKGCLRDFLFSKTLDVTYENHLLKMLKNVARGLVFLHEKSTPFAHRDLKSDNILLRENFEAVLADFGETKALKDGHLDDFVGSPYYIAPEVLRGEEYGLGVDIFSFGILLLEMSFYIEAYTTFNETVQSLIKKRRTIGLVVNHGQKSFKMGKDITKMIGRGWRPKINPVLIKMWPNVKKSKRKVDGLTNSGTKLFKKFSGSFGQSSSSPKPNGSVGKNVSLRPFIDDFVEVLENQSQNTSDSSMQSRRLKKSTRKKEGAATSEEDDYGEFRNDTIYFPVKDSQNYADDANGEKNLKDFFQGLVRTSLPCTVSEAMEGFHACNYDTFASSVSDWCMLDYSAFHWTDILNVHLPFPLKDRIFLTMILHFYDLQSDIHFMYYHPLNESELEAIVPSEKFELYRRFRATTDSLQEKVATLKIFMPSANGNKTDHLYWRGNTAPPSGWVSILLEVYKLMSM